MGKRVELGRTVIGCLLVDESTHSFIGKMKQEVFSDRERKIFQAIHKLYKEDKGIDMITVSQEGIEALDLMDCTEHVINGRNVEDYYSNLVEAYQAACLPHVVRDVQMDSPSFAFAEIQRKLDVLQSFTLSESKEYVDPIFDSFKPFDWGTKEANKEVTSIGNRDYVVFTGEQNSGKTSFMMDMAEKNAKAGRKILFLSLEMNTNDIMSQKAIARAGITKQQYNSKEFSETQQELYFKRQAELYDNENLLIWGMEGADPTVDNIIKRYKQSGAELLVLDNFDKITREKSTSQNQAEADISSKLLEVTKNGMPIVLVHHMRKGDSSKRSIMDIKGSSKIIHDATIVVNGSRLSIPPSLSAEEVKAIPHSDRAVFFLSEWKARMFGTLGVAKTFFHKGTFLDKENWDRENPPLFG